MNEHTNLLEIKDLTVHYVTVDGTVHAVENLNLTLPEGKTLGLVGETGAGKTTTVKAIMQILPDQMCIRDSSQGLLSRSMAKLMLQILCMTAPIATGFFLPEHFLV